MGGENAPLTLRFRWLLLADHSFQVSILRLLEISHLRVKLSLRPNIHNGMFRSFFPLFCRLLGEEARHEASSEWHDVITVIE